MIKQPLQKLLVLSIGLGVIGAVVATGDVSNERPPKDKLEAGQAAYLANCAACHQPDGKGLAGAFPPLAGSDFLKSQHAGHGAVLGSEGHQRQAEGQRRRLRRRDAGDEPSVR